ncbi:MAG TPA: thermopsin family protease [Thermoplasmata archaeon]|nr:thermopsin family protease [Thermoplasmata archaeon]
MALAGTPPSWANWRTMGGAPGSVHPTAALAPPAGSGIPSKAPPYPVAPPKIPARMPSLTANDSVYPYGAYSSEPAPMGVTDYGVDEYGNPYSYTTTTWIGEYTPTDFGTYNASLGSGAYTAGIQLNAVMTFQEGGTNYVYWTQDVALVDTQAKTIEFIDNVWNASAAGSSMYNSTIQGHGQVSFTSNGQGWYYYLDSTNYTTLSAADPIYFLMQVGITNGVPSVTFGDAINNGNPVAYDTARFLFATAPLQYGPLYLVDGNLYAPNGQFFDAELVVAGPGGGASTMAATSLQTYAAIEYLNGHNFQVPDNEFNFGSDTAETISGVVGTPASQGAIPIGAQSYGPGALGQLYDIRQVVQLNISGPTLNGGTVYLNSSSYSGPAVGTFDGNEWNGTIIPYTYSITVVSGGHRYVLPPLALPAGYTQITVGGNATTTYTVEFVESGLPAGTVWNVTFAGYFGSTTGTYIQFTGAKDGTYSFGVGPPAGYAANPANGLVTVNGANVTEAIVFTASAPGTYSVTFTESGLLLGTSWSVTLNGGTASSTSSVITFAEPNGAYNYSVGVVSGFTPSPSSGRFSVSGAGVSISVTFTATGPGSYAVIFSETGLSQGTSWSVTLNGGTASSTSSVITFAEANGAYNYTVGAVSGFTASPVSGTVSVSGASVSVSIAFTASGGGGTAGGSGFLGFSGSTGYIVVGGLAAVVVVGVIAAALISRSRAARNRRAAAPGVPPLGPPYSYGAPPGPGGAPPAAPPVSYAPAPPPPPYASPPPGAWPPPPPPSAPWTPPVVAADPARGSFCTSCGRPLQPTHRFCAECGQPRA